MSKLAGMDIIGIDGLRLHGRLGTKEWETMTRQEIILDVHLGIEGKSVALTDKLSDTINLVEVKTRLKTYVESATHSLCESLAHEIARILLTEFKISAAKVSLKKPSQFKSADWEFASIERSAADF